MSNTRIAFIGAGNMAASLIGGLRAKGLQAQQIRASDPGAETRARVSAEHGIDTFADNAEAIQGVDVVVLAVKPQAMKAVCESLRPSLGISEGLWTVQIKCGRGLAPDSGGSVTLMSTDTLLSGASPLPHLLLHSSFGSALDYPQGVLLFWQNPLGNHVVLVPERLFQGVDADRLATAWCVDKAVVAQVDGNVVDLAALEFEEQQVARFQILALNLLPVAGGHGVGGARQIHGRYVVKRIFHQTAAVEPFTWAAAAPTIRSTEHVDGAAEDGAALFGVGCHQAWGGFAVGLAQLSRAADSRLG